MGKIKQKILSVALWIFVAFCVILVIGMPFGIGTVLMLLSAVMAMPIAPVRKVWDVFLGMLPQEKKKLFSSKKKQAEKRKTNSKKTKLLIIAVCFLFGLIFGMAAGETTDPVDSAGPAYTTEIPKEESSEPTAIPTPTPAPPPAPTTVPTTEPTAEPTTVPTTEPTAEPTIESTVPDLPAESSFSIHFIDVGQADAALVECDGHYMLIDGGNKADSNVIYSVLKKASVSKLDIVVGTHAHEDHIGGLPGAYNYTTADLTLCPVRSYDSNAFEDFAKYAGDITVPVVGDTYSLGSSTVTILGVNGGSDTNDTSIVLRIDYGETSFLFTGDAERAAEQAVINSGADLSATVLKVGHHGSDTSTSYVFLREIMPQYAVISVGSDNGYGHPTEEVLSRLRDADVNLFRTDMQGDIYCMSDGKTVSFSVSRNPDADVFGGIGPNSTQEEPKESEIVVPQYNTTDALRTLLVSICGEFESDILSGALTYSIISATEVEVFYDVDELIYTDTEHLIDDVLDEILGYVVGELDSSDLPESVNVNATAQYDLYSEPEEEPEPAGTDYVGNKDSKKFHYAWCSSVDRMKESNKYYYTGTRDEMIAKGYVPCKNCDP